MSKKNKNKKRNNGSPATANQLPNKSAGNRSSTKKSQKNNPKSPLLHRRNALKLLIAVPVIGLAGAAIHRYDVQNKDLFDLTPLGKGEPMIIQVHDPACQPCKRLQNNTRKALKGLDDIVYRVADITTKDGAEFQKEYNSGITTLILFDKAGKRVDTIQGVATVDSLKERFGRLL